MIKKYKVNENECGYLIRRGRFEKLLTVGTYYFLSLSGCEVKIVPMTGAVNTCGIPEEILVENQENCVRIPMWGDIRSLNLSNSVAVVLYEALRQNGFEKMTMEGHLHRLHWKDEASL